MERYNFTTKVNFECTKEMVANSREEAGKKFIDIMQDYFTDVLTTMVIMKKWRGIECYITNVTMEDERIYDTEDKETNDMEDENIVSEK